MNTKRALVEIVVSNKQKFDAFMKEHIQEPDTHITPSLEAMGGIVHNKYFVETPNHVYHVQYKPTSEQ
ncbi:MAG: hypothetical protein ACMXYD_05240 [Candidatus Woesearchaeota archaeon]